MGMIRVDGISTFSFHQPESWSWFNIQTWRKSALRILASLIRKNKSVGISTGEYDIFYYYIDPRHPGTLPAESIWVAALQCSQWAIMPWTQWHLLCHWQWAPKNIVDVTRPPLTISDKRTWQPASPKFTSPCSGLFHLELGCYTL
jgi:hypothetical protein